MGVPFVIMNMFSENLTTEQQTIPAGVILRQSGPMSDTSTTDIKIAEENLGQGLVAAAVALV